MQRKHMCWWVIAEKETNNARKEKRAKYIKQSSKLSPVEDSPQRMFFLLYLSFVFFLERETREREKRAWQCTSFAWSRCSLFFTFFAHTFPYAFLLFFLSQSFYHHPSSLSLKRSALFSIFLCSARTFSLRWGRLIYWHCFTSTPSLDFASWKASFISLFRCLSFSLLSLFFGCFFLFIILIF